MEAAVRFRGFYRVGRQKSDGSFKITWGAICQRKTRNRNFKSHSNGTSQDKTAGETEMMVYNPVRKTSP